MIINEEDIDFNASCNTSFSNNFNRNVFSIKWKKQEGEIAGLIDHINPLVKKESSYVKTKKPDEFLEYDRVSYTQKAYDEQGESRNLTFTASQSLKLDKYLKITHKGAHVATYEEVNKQDIPKKAIEEIEK
ncbi:putative protein YxeA [Staphylococcus cohnii subsp. cohnii]|uniref:YxeA family protein n=1 Tax=Staphylococcus cohnii TaxID=29382 RepID=UPI001BB3539C|nr:YxeA family protein [Staphylococcus cohnii]MBB2508405.1 putative protein YxeA [Staphylococcus cohnii subsp. barensis]